MQTFIKNNKSDKIWWLIDTEVRGEFVFTFDKKELFYLYRDYDKMTAKQKQIFDRENPFWADFFKGRK